MFHRYGGWFKFVKVLKRKSLHRNGLTTKATLWANLFNNYLASFWIRMCALTAKLIVSTHKQIISFTCKTISRYLNMRKIKIQIFNVWNVILWMKIQNSAWFQYKNFQGWNFSFVKLFYIHALRTCFAMLT